jgi:hypothetical protein
VSVSVYFKGGTTDVVSATRVMMGSLIVDNTGSESGPSSLLCLDAEDNVVAAFVQSEVIGYVVQTTPSVLQTT